MSGTQALADFFKKWRIVILVCEEQYERFPSRVQSCYSGQFMSGTPQQICLCTFLIVQFGKTYQGVEILGLKLKRDNNMLLVTGNSSVTPYVCIVYIVCPLCTSFSFESRVFIEN